MPGPYDIGDAVTLECDFTDNDGVATNPTTVTCTVHQPDDDADEASSVTLTVEGSPTGHYEAVFQPTQEGTHYYRFAGTGALNAAEEGSFKVKRRRVPAV